MPQLIMAWWRHQMETFSALLAFCAGKSPVIGEFPAQRPVTRSFDVFIDLYLDRQLGKQWRSRCFETPSRSLWRHCNGIIIRPPLKLWHARLTNHIPLEMIGIIVHPCPYQSIYIYRYDICRSRWCVANFLLSLFLQLATWTHNIYD